MSRQRALGWLAFLGMAGIIGAIPEFFPSQEDRYVAPVGKPPVASVPLGTAEGAGSFPAGQPAGAGRESVPRTNLFASHSWRVIPSMPVVSQTAKAVAAATVVAPTAPPLPFQFIGKLDDAIQLKVFLLRGEQLHTVMVGDVIDGTYRVDGIAGNQMTLVYLPLNVSQSLSVGSDP